MKHGMNTGASTMYVEPAYPNLASDPRLTNVTDKWRTLNRQISDADWHGKPVTKVEHDKLSTLRQMVHDGKLYTPKF